MIEYFINTIGITKNSQNNLAFTSKIVLWLRNISYIMTSVKLNKPTEGELEILQVLWNNNKASVRTVHETLLKVKDCGYTTTLKLMQIMFEKGLVSRDDSNKIHIYTANVTREKTQKQFLNKMIDNSTTIVVNDSSSYHFIDKILNKKVNLIKNVISSSNMTSLSQKLFNNNKFEDIAYAEPVYVKKPYVN